MKVLNWIGMAVFMLVSAGSITLLAKSDDGTASNNAKAVDIESCDLKNKPKKVVKFDSSPNPVVVMKTDKGSFVLELFEDSAPNTVANFIHLVEKGHYKGSDFHRVEGVDDKDKDKDALRIVQGGRKDGSEQFDWAILNEAAFPCGSGDRKKNVEGTISMARSANLHSAGCQFFINLKDMPAWDNVRSPYAVFGKVVKNLDVVKKLRPDDKILDAWVVQKGGHDYNPWVIRQGANSLAKAKK